MTWSGTINADGSTKDLSAAAENKGTFLFPHAKFEGAHNPQKISGRYTRDYGNGKSESGAFTLTKRS